MVITDLTMPEMSGHILAQNIHTQHPEVPIFLCTGHADKLKEEPPGSGIRKIFQKPLDMEHFLYEIQQTLRPDQQSR